MQRAQRVAIQRHSADPRFLDPKERGGVDGPNEPARPRIIELGKWTPSFAPLFRQLAVIVAGRYRCGTGRGWVWMFGEVVHASAFEEIGRELQTGVWNPGLVRCGVHLGPERFEAFPAFDDGVCL